MYMLFKIWRVRQPQASGFGTKNFHQTIKNMFKFCSYPKTLKTNFIGYVQGVPKKRNLHK